MIIINDILRSRFSVFGNLLIQVNLLIRSFLDSYLIKNFFFQLLISFPEVYAWLG